MTMKVGHAHFWKYRSDWHEKKYRPGLWKFHSKQSKTRKGRKYKGFEGASIGTRFIWSINGLQRMTKVGANRYSGHMVGTKRFIRRYNARLR